MTDNVDNQASLTQSELKHQLAQAHDQLMHSEKMASIGQLAAGVAHEINNPIGYIRSNLTSLGEYCDSLLKISEVFEQALGERLQDPELQKAIEEHDLVYIREDLPALIQESHEGIERVGEIIKSLKDFSRTDTGEVEAVDIHRCLKKTLTVARNEIKYLAEVETDYGEIPFVNAVEAQIGQVFLNLLVNAAQSITERGVITITTRHQGDQVSIRVRDTGSGIAPDHLKRLFDPFFTTKPAGKGTGLGLSISYNIIKNHGGELSVESEPGVGTEFTVVLPINSLHEPV